MSGQTCPKCGAALTRDWPERWYACESFREHGGEFVQSQACQVAELRQKITDIESEVAALRAVYSIAIKALCDIDSGLPDHRTIAADALLRVERGANKTEGGEE